MNETTKLRFTPLFLSIVNLYFSNELWHNSYSYTLYFGSISSVFLNINYLIYYFNNVKLGTNGPPFHIRGALLPPLSVDSIPISRIIHVS